MVVEAVCPIHGDIEFELVAPCNYDYKAADALKETCCKHAAIRRLGGLQMTSTQVEKCDHYDLNEDGSWVYCQEDAVEYLDYEEEDGCKWDMALCSKHLEAHVERQQKDREETVRKEQGFCPECGYRKTNHSKDCYFGPHIF